MKIKINCKFNDDGTFCTNKKIKRSFLGMGPRYCVEYPDKTTNCEFKDCQIKSNNYPLPIKR